MTRTKAQISFEFILIFGLVFMTLVGFLYIMNKRISQVADAERDIAMDSLARNIRNEILLADSVNDNYLRRFDLPLKIASRDYNISIIDDQLIIEQGSEQHFSSLPREVKGDFIGEITENTTSHCITKTSEEIRISLNQASIDVYDEITVGDEFDAIVSLNCVINIRSIRFIISYDPDMLEYVRAESITSNANNWDNPLFDREIVALDYNGDAFDLDGQEYNFIEDGRFTFAFLGEPCGTGSGAIAKIRFKALQEGETTVSFDKLGGKELLLLDCETNQYTKRGLPESRNNEKIKITSP